MAASNNAVRYIAVYLVGAIFKIERQLMELFFKVNYGISD
jgi:hypothetical protein